MEKRILEFLGLSGTTVKKYRHGTGYSYPCFELAKKLKVPPTEVAKVLAKELGGWADGPYYKW